MKAVSLSLPLLTALCSDKDLIESICQEKHETSHFWHSLARLVNARRLFDSGWKHMLGVWTSWLAALSNLLILVFSLACPFFGGIEWTRAMQNSLCLFLFYWKLKKLYQLFIYMNWFEMYFGNLIKRLYLIWKTLFLFAQAYQKNRLKFINLYRVAWFLNWKKLAE